MDLSIDFVRKVAAFEHLWIALLVGIVLLVAWYAVAPYSTFKKLGIPGPAPWPFLGNLPDYNKKPSQPFLVEKEFVEKYGRVLGFYFGHTPAYMISDVDLLKQILVKEFSKFPNRPLAAIGDGQSIFIRKGLLNVQDDDWKRIRATITPTFSALKLKQVRVSFEIPMQLKKVQVCATTPTKATQTNSLQIVQ
ncbi:Thromboxane-A synthase [Desmophyllum pertusum]|uniref:Thromboxane-A synthase n=1 Tax=Desmophyllum pertusum TaxID=174260 RepID=A0A9X0A557_9CNID|nr:Thromboxane-A synthase [Desmophyllum pertusum]